jgi:hypothetical protein
MAFKGLKNYGFISPDTSTPQGQLAGLFPLLSSFAVNVAGTEVTAQGYVDGVLTDVDTYTSTTTTTVDMGVQSIDWITLQWLIGEYAQTTASLVLPIVKTGTVPATPFTITDSDLTGAAVADVQVTFIDDDISAVVWENTVVEWPTLCVPYAPSIFTEADVRTIFDDLGYIRKIEECLVKDHKVFFIHFNPGVLNHTMREMYAKLAEDKPVKVWVRERWFWYLRISNHEDHVQKVRKIRWQYDRWDGTGDYYEFAKDEIDDKTTLKLSQFLTF